VTAHTLLPWILLVTPFLGALSTFLAPDRWRYRVALSFSGISLLCLVVLLFWHTFLGQSSTRLMVAGGGLQIDPFGLPLVLLAAFLPWCLLVSAPLRGPEGKEGAVVLLLAGLGEMLAMTPHGGAWWLLAWCLTGFAYLTPHGESVSPHAHHSAQSRFRRGAIQARFQLLGVGLGLLLLLLPASRSASIEAWWAAPFLLVVMLRGQLFPFHVSFAAWVESAPLTRVAMTLSLMPAAYLLTLPDLQLAPWAASLLFWISLLTSLCAAMLAHGERRARRVVAWIVLSASSLVLAGLVANSDAAQLGAMISWLATSASACGLLMTLRAVEARRGRQSLDRNHGGYERMPVLAGSFLVLGLAMIGFPATLGMVGQELMLEGMSEQSLFAAALFSLISALNGICLLRTYFRLFCGQQPRPGSGQACRPRERLAFVVLIVVLFCGGLRPQPLLNLQRQALNLLDASPKP